MDAATDVAAACRSVGSLSLEALSVTNGVYGTEMWEMTGRLRRRPLRVPGFVATEAARRFLTEFRAVSVPLETQGRMFTEIFKRRRSNEWERWLVGWILIMAAIVGVAIYCAVVAAGWES